MNEFKTGNVVGTGAAINVILGWTPDYVEVWNVTDANQVDTWFRGMAAGTSIQTNDAVKTRAANGLSPYAGTPGGNSEGFTIGSAVSVNGKTLSYFAVRSGAGDQYIT